MSVREQKLLSDIQLVLLAHVASGRTVREAALEEHISEVWAYVSVNAAKKKLSAQTLPACVMRAHALGLLSHPTGYSERVFVTDAGFRTEALSLASTG